MVGDEMLKADMVLVNGKVVTVDPENSVVEAGAIKDRSKTDVNRDKLWEMLKHTGYRPMVQVSIDGDWSAMRFRPTERVKNR